MAESVDPAAASPYQRAWRRTLLDMHIPDWDAAFLSRFDPVALAELYERAGVTAVMMSCKSHAGLCHWPTTVGRMHGGLGGRDVVGELVLELDARGIATCAYYSAVFDSWAVEAHPDWSQRTIGGNDPRGLMRYGVCCPNHPEYLAYEQAQLRDLLSSYPFDAVFLDMLFWPLVCGCEHCRSRYREETGDDIPTVVDWTSAAWCRFQAARERWADELTAGLFAVARDSSPGIAVTHNLAPGLASWLWAQPLDACRHDTFVAGDLYGDRYEQLVVGKLALHLSETRPAELMTTRSVDLSDHVRTKRFDELEAAAASATALGSAFLVIDAVDPAGTVSAGVYERVGRVFERTEPFEAWLGGEPVEDVAVYFAVDSQMDFAENGRDVASFSSPAARYPHLDAVRGACRALQRDHVSFGVVTRRRLDELSRWRAIVLPSASRLAADEVAALRTYVRDGGGLYASGYSSLVDASGERHADFMLAEVFGVSFDGEEQGKVVYAKSRNVDVDAWFGLQSHLSHTIARPGVPLCGVPRTKLAGGVPLAGVSLPYGHPAPGSVLDHAWASIHSSPPWEDLDVPFLVDNHFGRGRCIYVAADIESVDAEINERLFTGVVRELIGGVPSFGAQAHPAVWMSAFDQGERLVVTLLNRQHDLPAAGVAVRCWLRPPAGARFVSLVQAPDGRSLPFELDEDGALHTELHVDTLSVLAASYER